MKHNRVVILIVGMLCAVLAGTAAAQSGKPSTPNAPGATVGTAFTYQGQIDRSGVLYNGTCDMQFTLWDNATAGVQQGATLSANAVPVNNGVFAVELDFGAQFKGEARWLEQSTKCADDADFTTMPRTPLNPTPYAIGLMPGAQVEGSNGAAANGPNGIVSVTNHGSGPAVVGAANTGTGVVGLGKDCLLSCGSFANGVYGEAQSNGTGVWGYSAKGIGVYGEAHADNQTGAVGIGKCFRIGGGFCVGTLNVNGVYGEAEANGYGVLGHSDTGVSVAGFSTGYARSDMGPYTFGTPAAMFGGPNGLLGFTKAAGGNGVSGLAMTAGGIGVYGYNFTDGIAVAGTKSGYDTNDLNSYGFAKPAAMFGGPNGVIGFSKADGGNGVSGVATTPGGTGIAGYASGNGYAAQFFGKAATTILEIRGGSDLAELFNVGQDKAEPGTLLVIDAANPGHLTVSRSAYDTKVAGIVSGAGDVKPGLTLKQEGVLEGDTQVAIAGRVYVKATGSNGPIEPGDLLTTSDRAGYAMKATDHDRSQGAVIGKAMTALDKGEGLVLVLVNLQ